MNWEIFGYIGTVLILVSFLIENVFKLRLVNTIGAIFWLVYGIGIMAKPTIIVNLAVIIIHGIWFIKQKKEPK
jgi:4-amino-4-deoxy-L-arabinose transferase-like glycosyltransferase